jgi:hypothetical protein
MKITKRDLKNIIKSILNESRFENMTQVEFFNVNQDELTPEEQKEYLESLRSRQSSDKEEVEIFDDFSEDETPTLDTNMSRRKFIKGGIIAAAIAAGSSFFTSLFNVNPSQGPGSTARSPGGYNDAEDLINILRSKGYNFSDGEIIPLSKQLSFNNEENARQGWSEDENMNRLFKYLAYWLSYHMPELGILTLEDMVSRNIAYSSEGADNFMSEFDQNFKEDKIASEFLGLGQSRGQFSAYGDMTMQASIPAEDAINVLGFHPDSIQYMTMPNGQVSLFEKVAVGTLEGIPVVVITEDAYDQIIFLK